jgi:serine/threonine-protein kinase
LPPKQELAADVTQAVALSPDGKRVAYVAAESGVSHLYVRRLDRFEAVTIPESEGAWFPFFSPNGDWVAFFNQGKLKKAPADGGVPVEICQMSSFFGGTWTPKDVIVVSVPNFGMATIPASGGSLHTVPTSYTIYPQGLTWLAGGDWIAFTDYFSPRRSISVVNVNTGEMRVLLENAQSPSYSAGHLIYYQGGALWAVPFDPDKLVVLGSPSEIETGVTEENYLPQASAARTGVLAYAPGSAGNFARNLFLVNRQGIDRKLDLPPKDYIDPAFSPDGKRIAIVIRSVQQLEVVERDRGAVTSIAPTFANFAATWTADGKNLLFDAIPSSPERTFATDASQERGFYRAAADGSSGPELIRIAPQVSHITSVAGDYAAVMVNDPVTNTDLWLLRMHPRYEMQPFKRTPAVERQGSLSPDAQWMAYVSNESGRSEIYVEPVPGPGGRKQISMEGGEQPRWVRNGREIVYRNGTKMMSVSVQIQPVFQAGKPVELFDRKFDRGAAVAAYDVTADGQTFVMTRSERDNPTEIRVVIGWPAGVQKPK